MPQEDEIVQKCTFVSPNNSSHQRLKNQRTPDMSHIEKDKKAVALLANPVVLPKPKQQNV